MPEAGWIPSSATSRPCSDAVTSSWPPSHCRKTAGRITTSFRAKPPFEKFWKSTPEAMPQRRSPQRTDMRWSYIRNITMLTDTCSTSAENSSGRAAPSANGLRRGCVHPPRSVRTAPKEASSGPPLAPKPPRNLLRPPGAPVGGVLAVAVGAALARAFLEILQHVLLA